MPGSGMAEALKLTSSKVRRKGAAVSLELTPPPPRLQPAIDDKPKSIVHDCKGICTTVGVPIAKSEVLTERTRVRSDWSSNWKKSVGARLPVSRWAVIVRKFMPVVSSERPRAPQPLSLTAVPATVIEPVFCVTWPTQLVPVRTPPELGAVEKEESKIDDGPTNALKIAGPSSELGETARAVSIAGDFFGATTRRGVDSEVLGLLDVEDCVRASLAEVPT